MAGAGRLTESIKELLGAGRAERLADVLEESHAADVSAALRELPLPEQVHLFRLLAPMRFVSSGSSATSCA